MKSVNTELEPRLPEWGFFIAPSLRPGGRGSSVNMKNQKSVLVAHLENVLQSFASNGGGTGRTLVKKLDKGSAAEELGGLYLKLVEDSSDMLVLDSNETATVHQILQDLMRSFTHNTRLSGKALTNAVRRDAAEEKEMPVSAAEIALYLRLDAAVKREAKQAA